MSIPIAHTSRSAGLIDRFQNKKPAAVSRGGFCSSIIVMRRFPFLADLAATYSSKP